ncbi:MAG: DUF1015 domain-containing protein [Candidatus Methanoplasma sp.]|jgi:uncharacterized protein (DUF1015 family)|nr:DUF1015 domain-containing protein [Candidatus Methanoplasma sp.]
MVTFLPFPGFRPALAAGEQIGDRVSPPYDVIGEAYLRELQSNANNIANLTLKRDADGRYLGARAELDRMASDGSLEQDGDSFYLYEQTFEDHGAPKMRRGIVGILKTEEYCAGNVIPHEETFSKVKEDRLNLLRDMEAHLESIFCVHEGLSDGLNCAIAAAAKLLYRHVDGQNVEHRFYRIADEAVAKRISDEFADRKVLIADGHHRYETALNYSKENPWDRKKGFVLATLVSAGDGGLVVWPTHRLVDSPGTSEGEAIASMSESMEVRDAGAEELRDMPGDWMFGMIFRSGRRMLARLPGGEGLWGLDTYVAQELVIKKAYGYGEGDASVSYDAELDSVERSMGEGGHDLAIVLRDPSLKAIWDLSMAGMRMPKKTTFFFPKIWSGFAIYRMS